MREVELFGKVLTMSDSKNKKTKELEILDKTIDSVVEKKSAPIDIIIDSKKPSDLLPSISPSREITKVDPLRQYIKEISRYDLLNPEEEERLARKLLETGSIDIAKKLVRANLRLVVKIAMEYRSSYSNVLDLIQEGNIGLMKAVSKYDPDKGARLSYYASWWIKSYILKFILDNFRLVRIGTTADQKKLFFNLMKEKERLEKLGIKPDVKMLSENLGVSEKAVSLMDERIGQGVSEYSIDRPLFDDSSRNLGDILTDEGELIEDEIGHAQEVDILKGNLHNFIDSLKERDQEIFKKRLLNEVPLSLQAIADDYGVSRERIRQIEERLIEKLRVYMSEFIR